MAEILGALSWESGNLMVNDADRSNGVEVTSDEAHTETYSMSLGRSSIGAFMGWGRFGILGSPSNPSVSVWCYLKISYETEATDIRGSSIRFLLTTGEYVELRWNATNHTYDAYVDDVKVADGTIEVSMNDWFQVQFYAVIDNAGSIGVRIDGHQSIDYSGDTQPAGAAGASYVRFQGGAVGTGLPDYYDDLVWGEGGYLGSLRCYEKRPTADTAQDDWTPSVGENYECVDETPENDADYNSTAVSAQADELVLEDFDGSDKTPRAVVAWLRAREESATGESVKVGVDSNGTDETTTHALSTDWEYYFHVADDDPDGDIPWADAAIDALLLRYESLLV